MEVVTLLKERGINYQSRGRDYVIRCLNPAHEDVHPSMRIDKITGLFNCPSCGFGGDIYGYFNINKEKFIDIKVEKLREKIQKILSTKSIALPLDAKEFTGSFRGIKESTIKKFGAFTSDSLMEGRIIFPIYDYFGRTVGFQGRYIYSDVDPKYEFYPHNMTVPLYPSDIKPINNSIILVEGIFDMLNMHDKGLTNTVCTFGTVFGSVKKKYKKRENLERLMFFKYQGIDSIYVMYDGDKSGRDAAENLIEYAQSKFSIDSIDLDDGVDPGKLTQDQIFRLRGLLYG